MIYDAMLLCYTLVDYKVCSLLSLDGKPPRLVAVRFFQPRLKDVKGFKGDHSIPYCVLSINP